MGKAILVMDMPKNCYECKLHFTKGNCEDICMEKDKYIEVNIFTRKPKWCPLREVPRKQMHYPSDDASQRCAKNGWDACIDEILKTNEGEKINGSLLNK